MRWDRKSAAVLVSMGTNTFLVLLKVLLAILSGSLALLADAIHSGSDILVDVLVFVGIRVSGKKTIPSPLRIKIENTVAIIISYYLVFSLYHFYEGVGRRDWRMTLG